MTPPSNGTSAPSTAISMRERLRAVLAPAPGERILEVGAGNGYYALHVADDVGPGGAVDLVDAHPQMLEAALHGASERGLRNVAAVLGDPRHLPFGDACFDAVYLVAALGDAPDQQTVLHELARILRPEGRVVVGELNGDPHRVEPAKLCACCAATALCVTRRIDDAFGYLAVLELPRR